MRMPSANSFCAHLVAQEAGLARDRGAVGGAGEMRDQRAGHARIEHHRHLAGRHLARIEPLDRALAGGAADFLRAFQIGGVPHARIIVIALHAGAFAGDRGHRQAVAGAEIGAAKAVAGHQHHAADAGRGGGAARLGDALDRERRPLRRRAPWSRAARPWAGRDRSGRDRENRAPAAPSSASPAYLSSGAARAIATARSASAALPSLAVSLVDTTAWRLPTSTRRPRSSPSARSLSSTAPSRTSIDSDIERTATASAASAPAARAALTSRSARSVRAVWSNKDEAGACMMGTAFKWA